MQEYSHKDIEKKWQTRWRENGFMRADLADTSRKYYCLTMYPYPSGDLHVGHGRNYIIGDALARYKLMEGMNVLAPMGWDAFGLPAENAAIKMNIHPARWTRDNIAKMKKQFEEWGVVYDWSREVASCDPSYYKWTQWLFIKLYENGLAYRKAASVNWCPSCKTVLANEQVVGGLCERCDSNVEEKYLEQWFFKITSFADRLLNDLQLLKNWPDRVIIMQKNWIDRSEGTEIDFEIKKSNKTLKCFSTRSDTLFGATFIVISPEHPDLPRLINGLQTEKTILSFIKKEKERRLRSRGAVESDKRGAFTGIYAVNPVTGKDMPIYTAPYVLMGYGTGMIMGVPAHDQRDFDFAVKHGITMREVVRPKDGGSPFPVSAYEGKGILMNSGEFDGLSSDEGIGKNISQNLQVSEKGKRRLIIG